MAFLLNLFVRVMQSPGNTAAPQSLPITPSQSVNPHATTTGPHPACRPTARALAYTTNGRIAIGRR
jgi:hypothetical protein